MSVKDLRYKRFCPICEDVLPGTDDALEVYESLVDQLEEGIHDPNCTLCGEDVDLEKAKAIVAAGKPKLYSAKGKEIKEK